MLAYQGSHPIKPRSFISNARASDRTSEHVRNVIVTSSDALVTSSFMLLAVMPLLLGAGFRPVSPQGEYDGFLADTFSLGVVVYVLNPASRHRIWLENNWL